MTDYWAAKLPVNVGRDNFDTIRYDYYRDGTVALEAFKAGEYDFRQENVGEELGDRLRHAGGDAGRSSRRRRSRTRCPPACRGSCSTRAGRSSRIRACARRWPTRSTSSGATRTCSTAPTRGPRATSRTRSSPRAGCPSGDELKVLEPFRGRVPDEVFTKEYQPPTTDGSGNIRDGVREALRLLERGGLDRQGAEAGQRPAASRCSSRSCSTTRPGSASRCPSRRTSSGSASPRACGRSTPPSTRTGRTTSTST